MSYILQGTLFATGVFTLITGAYFLFAVGLCGNWPKPNVDGFELDWLGSATLRQRLAGFVIAGLLIAATGAAFGTVAHIDHQRKAAEGRSFGVPR